MTRKAESNGPQLRGQRDSGHQLLPARAEQITH